MDPDPTKPQKTRCAKCKKAGKRGNHLTCRFLTAGADCGCDCPWLKADMWEHFPSLRRIALEEQP